MIKSISDDQRYILNSIRELHLPEGFECDVTFGNGGFWKGTEKPKLCYDIEPLLPFVQKSCSTNMNLANGALDNIVFDPPFLTYINSGRVGNGNMVMAKRFGGYYSYQDLTKHYKASIAEFSRVLKKGGKLIFKCQDIIHNHKMFCTHVNVINWCESSGFRLLDLFILTAKHRMPSQGKQQHARIFHSYFLVFKKL